MIKTASYYRKRFAESNPTKTQRIKSGVGIVLAKVEEEMQKALADNRSPNKIEIFIQKDYEDVQKKIIKIATLKLRLRGFKVRHGDIITSYSDDKDACKFDVRF